MADSNPAPEADGTKKPTGNGIAAQSQPAATNTTSNADKKKQQKAEKAARRAKAKDLQAAASNVSPNVPAPENHPSQSSNHSRNDSKQTNKPKSQQQHQQQQQPPPPPPPQAQHKRSGSIGSASQSKSLPVRAKPSHTTPKDQTPEKAQIPFVSHLHGQPHRRTLEGTPKDIHPAVSAFALQQSSYTICGSHARCVAMLLALKSVVNSYTTPHGTSLPRHLVSHLSPQLAHVKSSRPFSVSQANAIRWLKNLIATIDPALAEDEAKAHVAASIDTFIRDKFTVADQVIAETASQRIVDGDVIITFGKSAVVQSTIIYAAKQGKKFKVVVIDSRPLFEGKNLARYVSAHVEVEYALVTGISQALQAATKCILGAHAVYANGRLQSRIGASLLTMAAKARKVPVIVCTESIKLSDHIAIDSIVGNELAPEDELLDLDVPKPADNESKNNDSLQILNLLYDMTPAENIDVVITELGSFPPTSALVVHRISVGS